MKPEAYDALLALFNLGIPWKPRGRGRIEIGRLDEIPFEFTLPRQQAEQLPVRRNDEHSAFGVLIPVPGRGRRHAERGGTQEVTHAEPVICLCEHGTQAKRIFDMMSLRFSFEKMSIASPSVGWDILTDGSAGYEKAQTMPSLFQMFRPCTNTGGSHFRTNFC